MTIIRNTPPKQGFASRDFPVHPEDEASIIALYRAGLGDAQIASKMLFKVDILKSILHRLIAEGRIAPRSARRALWQVKIYKVSAGHKTSRADS